MLWHQQNPITKSIFLNFQHLIEECIQKTNPDKEYFFEKKGNDFYFASKIPFPLMNGIISQSYSVEDIQEKCKIFKEKFKKASYPITWFWMHDTLPIEVNEVFNTHGLKSMGKYTSVAVESKKVKKLSTNFNKEVQIVLVETDKDFKEFLEVTKIVYGMSEDVLPFMAHLYSAYKHSNNIKLYLAKINDRPASTLLSFQNGNTLGLYNGATLMPYRKKGLLTSLILNSAKEVSQIDYIVAQLMAAQNAKSICDQFGGKEYSHFYPFCFGYNLDKIYA